MSKREKIEQVLVKYSKERKSSTFYVVNVPEKKAANAVNAYAKTYGVKNEDVIGLYDYSVFGGAKTGFIFTEKGFYINMIKSKGELIYEDIKSIELCVKKDSSKSKDEEYLYIIYKDKRVMSLYTSSYDARTLGKILKEICALEDNDEIINDDHKKEIFNNEDLEYINSNIKTITKNLEILNKCRKYSYNIISNNIGHKESIKDNCEKIIQEIENEIDKVSHDMIQINYFDGSWYHGQIKGEMANGYGTFKYASGQIYKGKFLKGARHGKGIITKLNKEGLMYVGDFNDDKRKGRGILISPSKYLFEGEFSDNDINGKGVCLLHKQGIYLSNYIKNDRSERGIYIDIDGTVFQTCYESKDKDRNEVAVYMDGSVLIGDFKNRECCGSGIMIYKNGTSRQGNYFEGKRHGKFVFTDLDNSIRQEEWKDDVLIKKENNNLNNKILYLSNYINKK